MLPNRIAELAIIASLVASCGTSDPVTLQPDPPPLQRAASFQDALNRWASRAGHWGVQATIILPDGSEWSGVAGIAGSSPLDAGSLIRIASITKTMTAAIALQLVQQERLSLDDTVGTWIRGFPNIPGRITLRQLMNHTSGLANYTASPVLSTAIAAAPTRVVPVAELLSYIGPPSFAPGTRTEYTNSSILVLGRILEELTGKHIVTLYHERLWDPLGLKEIFLPGYEDAPAPTATTRIGAAWVDPMQRIGSLSAGHAAFGLLSNARTVARWGRALFTGSLLNPTMQGAMRTLVPAAGNIPGESGAGLGIRAYNYHGRLQLGHSGGSAEGSSLLLYDVTTRITVAVVMNQGAGADHFALAPELLALASAQSP